MKKRAIILGSTGSVGRQALDVLADVHDEWEVVGLAAGSNHQKLAEQANRFRPQTIAIGQEDCGSALDAALSYAPMVFSGDKALLDLVDRTSCDWVISAVVGSAGLAATLRAVALGRRVALANKEALVIAGSLLMPLARQSGAEIIPVDSEHSAIFQASWSRGARRSEDGWTFTR